MCQEIPFEKIQKIIYLSITVIVWTLNGILLENSLQISQKPCILPYLWRFEGI